MNPLEQQLLRDEIGDKTPALCIRTLTRVDVGQWFGRRLLWFCIVDDRIITLSVGRRRHIESIAISDCPDIHYNPTSSELILDPLDDLEFPRIKMTPSDALSVMRHLESTSPTLTPQH